MELKEKITLDMLTKDSVSVLRQQFINYNGTEMQKGTTPYCVKKVAVLNSWGKIRSWGCHMVHHALYQKQNYSGNSSTRTLPRKNSSRSARMSALSSRY